jgi:hypothetical protein
MTQRGYVWALIIAGIAIVLVSIVASRVPSQTISSGMYSINSDAPYWGCDSLHHYNRIMAYIQQDDSQAAAKLFVDGVRDKERRALVRRHSWLFNSSC